jgi:hypothetical protein
MRTPNRSEGLALAISATLVGLAAWIGVSQPSFGPAEPIAVVQDPSRAHARLRVRVQAVAGRLDSLEQAVEDRTPVLVKIEASLAALEDE